MKWSTFSKKQLQLLTWWTDNSPYFASDGIICDGAVRSGKTIVMGLSFIVWSMQNYENYNFAICGKTVGSLRRNVITPLKVILINRGYKVIDRKTDNMLVVSKGRRRNSYYLFGGRDERSQDLIQGITLAGILFDEVALMPRSFVEQGMARCSVDGSKYWFNCNPDGPNHWFYVEHVLKCQERNYLHLHFNIEDNPSLTERIINRYKSMFKGIFYRRFILGEWAFADGIVYDCFDPDKHTYSVETRNETLPWQIREHDPITGRPYIGCDYGTYNPMCFLKGYKYKVPGDNIPYFYIDQEYYYDGRGSMRQKSDSEYVDDMEAFIGQDRPKAIIVDPSAASFITALRKRSIPVLKAKNDVPDGISMVYTLMAMGHILINKDKCPKLLQELGLYIWDEKKQTKGKEEVVKTNDHACDALRYLIYSTTNRYEVFDNLEQSIKRKR